MMLESITDTKPAAHGAHAGDDSSAPLPKPVQMPAGRSVPSALMITLLLLVGTLIAVLPPKTDGLGFSLGFLCQLLYRSTHSFLLRHCANHSPSSVSGYNPEFT